MPDSLFGLPTHILLLHMVVVLLPIAVIATVGVVLSSRFRRRWGLAVVAGTALTALFVPLTTQSGESLAARLPLSVATTRHAQIGQRLVVWAAVFGLCLAGVVFTDLVRRASAKSSRLTPAEVWAHNRLPSRWFGDVPGWADPAFRIFQGLALITSIVVIVVVIQAGHSGAQAVWSRYPGLAPR